MRKIFFKTFVALFAVVATSTTLSAQGAYGTLNIGYGFNAAAETAGSNSTSYYNLDTWKSSGTEEIVNASLGKGINIGGALGYMFNKNIGAELGVNYLIGGKTEFTDFSTSESTSNTQIDNTTYSGSANMIRFMPTIVLATGMDKFNPYAKFGVVIGSSKSNLDLNSTYTNTFDNSTGESAIKYEMSGDLAFGYTAALGANYSLSDKLSLFGELNLISMSYAYTKGEITESSINGESNLAYLTTRDKFTDYVDKITFDSSAPIDENTPSQELLTKNAFSSIGLNFGIKYNF